MLRIFYIISGYISSQRNLWKNREIARKTQKENASHSEEAGIGISWKVAP